MGMSERTVRALAQTGSGPHQCASVPTSQCRRILTPPLSCNGGTRGFMKPNNSMRKFERKDFLAPCGLFNADVAGTARRPREDSSCSSHRSRSLLLKDSNLVVHP